MLEKVVRMEEGRLRQYGFKQTPEKPKQDCDVAKLECSWEKLFLERELKKERERSRRLSEEKHRMASEAQTVLLFAAAISFLSLAIALL